MPALPSMRRTVGRLRLNAFTLLQQLGKVGVVRPGVTVAGQFHHGSDGYLGDGVVRSASPVPVGQCGGVVLAVSGEQTLGVAFADSHGPGSLGDGELVFQNAVEHLNPGLFLRIQLYIPHGDDIAAEQLTGDQIVDHQHNDIGATAPLWSGRAKYFLRQVGSTVILIVCGTLSGTMSLRAGPA